MSKRYAETQGGEDRYGAYGDQQANTNSSAPQRATAAQMANRKIASAKSSVRSARSSRANTPTANPFASGQPQNNGQPQNMSFQPGSNSFTFSAGPGAPAAPTFDSPAEPSFGGMNTQQPQQNGGGGLFGSTTSGFGGSGFGSQSQQNGTAQSANGFGQNGGSGAAGNSAPTFGGFGQTANGNNASTSFGGFSNGNNSQTQNGQANNNNPFASFGQNNTQPSFTGFGAPQSQPNTASTPSTSFGSFSQPQQNGSASFFGANKPDSTPQTTGSVFKGFQIQSQPPADKSAASGEKSANLFAPASQSASTLQAPSNMSGQGDGNKSNMFGHSESGKGNTFGQQDGSKGNVFGQPAESKGNAFGQQDGSKSSMFGSQQGNKSTGLFGSSAPSTQGSTPDLGNSILSGLNQKSSEVKTGMFTQSTPNQAATQRSESPFKFGQPNSEAATATINATPKPSSSLFQFGAQNGASSVSNEQTPKPSSLFQSAQQSDAFKPAGASQTEQPAPKPSSLFSFGADAAKPTSAQAAPAAFSFGIPSQKDNGAQDSSSVPQTSIGSTAAASNPFASSTPFKPVDKAPADISQTPKPSLFQPSSTLFNQSNEPSKDASKSTNLLVNGPGASLFDRVTRDEPTPQAPARSKSPLPWEKPDTPDNVPPAKSFSSAKKFAPAASSPLKAPAQTASFSPPAASSRAATGATSTMDETMTRSEMDTFKALNEGLKLHLTKQNPLADWTSIFQYYLEQAAEIRNKPAPKPAAAAPQKASSSLAPKPTGSKHVAQSSLQPQPHRQPSNLQATPARPGAAATIDFSKTAPAKKQRADDDDAGTEAPRAPATEKRSRPTGTTDYAPLPKQASNASKLFQSLYNSEAGSSSTANAPQPRGISDHTTQQREESAAANDQPERSSSPHFGPPASMLEKAREERDKAQSVAPSPFKPSSSLFSAASANNASASAPSFSGFTPAAPAAPTTKPTFTGFGSSGVTSSGGNTASATAPSTAAKPAASGFTPTGFTPAASTQSGFTPTGFTPSGANAGTSSAGTSNFMAAFGSKASKQADADRKKRKAEDFDSDEDNEEEWEAKYKAEQEAKRQKLLDAAKTAKGFTFTSGTPAPSGQEAAKKTGPTAADETPRPATGGSLFDLSAPPATEPARKGLFDFSGNTSQPQATSLFSNLGKSATDADKTDGEKGLGSGDNTWKPETPIKFGGFSGAKESFTPATAPPKNMFGSLFGPTAGGDKTSTNGQLGVPGAKSGLNFHFGGAPSSMGTSRATTPGVTTDGEAPSTAGEGGEGGDDDAPKDPQMEDLTGLREEELAHEDVVVSVAMAKALKWVEDKKDAASGEVKPGWAERGKGPVYVLRHRDTGKVRVILKVPPFGKAAMNFGPLRGADYANASAKSVKGPFVDHLDPRDAESGKVSSWLIQVGKPDDAKAIQKALSEGASG